MTTLPPELADFPHHLLDKLRKGVISPREKQELLEKGSGWLYRLSEINTETHSSYKMAVVMVKMALAKGYAHGRSQGMSVSGAKLHAETSDDYILELKEEQKTEAKWRYFKGFYEANLETINALKVSIKLDMAEWKYSSGGTDGQS